jgi:hypothetical protein
MANDTINIIIDMKEHQNKYKYTQRKRENYTSDVEYNSYQRYIAHRNNEPVEQLLEDIATLPLKSGLTALKPMFRDMIYRQGKEYLEELAKEKIIIEI